jgi:ABC-2 type transport system permease protein
MNSQSNALSESLESQRVAAATMSVTRPMYWSVRRELWENRYLYVAPVVVAGVFLIGFLISTIHLPAQMGSLAEIDPAKRWDAIAMPYNIVAGAMMGTLILMSAFYCAEALHGERQDRSILFWKSLPVSDLTTVLAKASVPLVILPLMVFAITVATQIVMLLLSSVVLLGSGVSVAPLWTQWSIAQMWGLLLYHLVTAHALWPFPVYCWLLLVSGWARRATLLWAALPVLIIGGIEKLAFNTSHFAGMVGGRLIGAGAPTDFTAGDMVPLGPMPLGPMTHITPGRLLGGLGLWAGLLIAAIFLIAAVRIRRYQTPL